LVVKLPGTIPYQLKRLWKDTLAQDLIEYALLVSLAAFTAGAAVPSIADDIRTVISHVQSALNAAGGRAPRSRGDKD